MVSRINASWVVLGCAGLLLSWVFWCLWWPFEPITVHQDSWTIMNTDKTVRRGETLVVRMNYCKHANITAQMVASIEQGPSLWLLGPQQPAFTLGCHEQNVGIVQIPAALPMLATNVEGHGKAVLRVRLNYAINPLRTATYAFVTDEFTIVP